MKSQFSPILFYDLKNFNSIILLSINILLHSMFVDVVYFSSFYLKYCAWNFLHILILSILPLYTFILVLLCIFCFIIFIIILFLRFLLVEVGVVKHLVAALQIFIDRSDYLTDERDDNSMTALCLAIGRLVSTYFFVPFNVIFPPSLSGDSCVSNITFVRLIFNFWFKLTISLIFMFIFSWSPLVSPKITKPADVYYRKEIWEEIQIRFSKYYRFWRMF